MSPTDTAPAIVIGSGFGGLAAAIRLRALGHRVKVLEAGDEPGRGLFVSEIIEPPA